MITNLMRIRQAHKLTSRQVADQAGIPLAREYVAEIGGLVEQEEAEKIAMAISTLARRTYAIGTLGMAIKLKEDTLPVLEVLGLAIKQD